MKKITIKMQTNVFTATSGRIDTLTITKDKGIKYKSKVIPFDSATMKCSYSTKYEEVSLFEKFEKAILNDINKELDVAYLDGPTLTIKLIDEEGLAEEFTYDMPIYELPETYKLIQQLKSDFMFSLGEIFAEDEEEEEE